MPFDLDRVRRETPGCAHVLHLNNAGAALMPKPVLDACTRHLQLEATIGGYEAADAARQSIERTYAAIAGLLNARTAEIAIVDSATRAWNMAFYGLPLAAGDRILTARASYASNFIGYLNRAKSGVAIDVAPPDESGQVDVTELERRITSRTRLIALTHVPTNGGLVNPAEDVGRVARRHGIPFLLDACQSAGQLPLDVEKIGCDMLSATGRKYLRGPRGTGFLFVRSDFLERLDPPTPDLHGAEWTSPTEYRLRDDARRFELWESNLAATIGLGAAVKYALEQDVRTTWTRIEMLAASLRERVAALDGATVRDVGRVRGGIVTFDLAQHDPHVLKKRLRELGINVSVSEPNSTLLDARSRSLPPMIRASVHYYNTEEEIERFIECLEDLVAERP